jgi:hypothetical protein
MYYLIFGEQMRIVEDPIVADNLLRKGWQKGPIKPGENFEWNPKKGVWVEKLSEPQNDALYEQFLEFMKSKEAQK